MLSRCSLQAESDNPNLCTQLLYNSWAMCDNHGRGGYLPVEAGCLRYSLVPKGGPFDWQFPLPDDDGPYYGHFRGWQSVEPNIPGDPVLPAAPDQASNYS